MEENEEKISWGKHFRTCIQSGLGICFFALSLKIALFEAIVSDFADLLSLLCNKEQPWANRSCRSFFRSWFERIELTAFPFQKVFKFYVEQQEFCGIEANNVRNKLVIRTKVDVKIICTIKRKTAGYIHME